MLLVAHTRQLAFCTSNSQVTTGPPSGGCGPPMGQPACSGHHDIPKYSSRPSNGQAKALQNLNSAGAATASNRHRLPVMQLVGISLDIPRASRVLLVPLAQVQTGTGRATGFEMHRRYSCAWTFSAVHMPSPVSQPDSTSSSAWYAFEASRGASKPAVA